jgi:hypothetical protein
MNHHDSDDAALLIEHRQDIDLEVMTEADIDKVAGGFNLTWDILKIIFN